MPLPAILVALHADSLCAAAVLLLLQDEVKTKRAADSKDAGDGKESKRSKVLIRTPSRIRR